MKINKKVLIIFNGKGGTGKDTCIKSLSEYFNLCNISSIDPIKKIAEYFGYDNGKSKKDRKFLSDLKLAASEYNNFSTNYLLEKIRMFANDVMVGEHCEYLDIFCTHIRESDEIDSLKSEMKTLFPDIPVITILIRSNRIDNNNTYGNVSDDMVDDYEYDDVYYNDGLVKNIKSDFIKFIIALFEKNGIKVE